MRSSWIYQQGPVIFFKSSERCHLNSRIRHFFAYYKNSNILRITHNIYSICHPKRHKSPTNTSVTYNTTIKLKQTPTHIFLATHFSEHPSAEGGGAHDKVPLALGHKRDNAGLSVTPHRYLEDGPLICHDPRPLEWWGCAPSGRGPQFIHHRFSDVTQPLRGRGDFSNLSGAWPEFECVFNKCSSMIVFMKWCILCNCIFYEKCKKTLRFLWNLTSTDDKLSFTFGVIEKLNI